jgi:hypothetical protein
MKPVRLLCLFVAMAAALGSLANIWQARQPERLVEHYQSELAALADDAVEPPLRQLAELGDPGLRALAGSLASDRLAVRRAARQVLFEEVDRWELLSEEAVALRLESLAHGLAAVAPRLDVENRRPAADLALRLLLWPHETEGRPRDWLADCESVLAAAAERGHSANGTAAALLADKNASVPNPPQPLAGTGSPDFSDLGMTLTEKVELPGGGLPMELSLMPDGRGFVEPRIARDAEPTQSHEPRRLQLPPNTRAIDGDEDDNDDEQSTAANRPRRLPSAGGNSRQAPMGLQSRNQALGGPMADDTAAWRQLPPRDVMRRLHMSDPQVVMAARVELGRRGISGPLVDLARRATDPDPKVRRQFAESLPSLPGIDAKPWLMELSYDENAQVRATAVTLMATSGDMELLRRLEQISRDDPDDYIRAQAAKAEGPRPRN